MRQNTPHPRELKAKAHKLFGKGGKSPDAKDVDEVGPQHADVPAFKVSVVFILVDMYNFFFVQFLTLLFILSGGKQGG